jgi:CRP-like cAMP-binding protein
MWMRLLRRVLAGTFGWDGGSEDQDSAQRPGTWAAGEADVDRPRWAASRPRMPAANQTRWEQPPGDSFWAALDETERRDFMAVALQRTFAGGATLMHEGESADHVIVVLSGRTKICVYEHGRELLLAERGPGQLIGERAALEVSVRSATVVALTTVEALVVTTKRFAEFVSTHSRVLGLVERQVYARLTEGPERVIPRRLTLVGENCTVMLTDVEGFGGRHRSEEDRQFVRRALYEMTSSLLDGLGVACSCEDRGDGFLMVIPPGVPTARVVERLLADLPLRLRRHNHTYSAAMQIRLRVAVDVGPVVSDPVGMTGDTIINVARLVEAPILKQRMAARHSSLGVIASLFVYDTAIKPAFSEPDSGGYELVQVTVKESSLPAWLKLIGPDASRGPLMSVAITRSRGRETDVATAARCGTAVGYRVDQAVRGHHQVIPQLRVQRGV